MLNALFGSVAALFVGMSIAALIHLRWARRLPALEATTASPGDHPILCSVVLAARNEEDRIEKTIRHLLAQSAVSIEIIAVDDRSSDRTGAILARLATEDSRLHVTRVATLPEGWLGKCHACHTGASIARGEWILFTDADTWLKEDVIARALQVAEQDKADHVTLTPGLAVESFAARAWYLMFLTSFLSWIAGVNQDRPKAHLGLGAFNLVRASVYREIGGYQTLRLSIVDDIKLGLLISRAGKRTRAFLGAGDVECHWGTTLSDMVRVMEKNYFAVLNFRLAIVLAGGLLIILVLCILVAGLIVGTPLGIAAALAPSALIVPAAMIARRMGWPWYSALGAPFIILVFQYSVCNSAYVTLRQGGIRWRETFYPLEQLRAGNVQ
jgi:cellulose synthase/poly-beta-1,6-N-acetylglucosamine synthase-like glycosyltransferase